MISQKNLLLIAVFLSSGSMFVGIPFIGLNLENDHLALATFAIMFNSMIGIFDIIRPVVTRVLAMENQGLSSVWLLRTGAYSGLILGAFGYIGLSFASVPFVDHLDILLFSICIFVFCIVSSFWGVMDARGFVGTAQLYRAMSTCAFVFALVFQGYFQTTSNPSLVLLISLIILTVLMISHISSRRASNKKNTTRSIKFSEFGYLLLQNLAKLPVDFADRFVAAKLLPAAQYASYGLIYEYVSKLSVAPQLISAYYYPKLCSKAVSAESFFNYGIGVCIVLIGLGWLSYFTLDAASMYLFDTSFSLSWLIPAMLCFFASHSLSFFGQAVGRSFGLQRGLAVSFGMAGGLGAILLFLLLPSFGASTYILALSLAGFKSSFLFFAPFLFGKVAYKVVGISIFLCILSLTSGVTMIILRWVS